MSRYVPSQKSPARPRLYEHRQLFPLTPSLNKPKTMNELQLIQSEYDAKLAELDRIIAENNAKLAKSHLAMQSAIADAQTAIATAIEKLSQ